MASSYYTIENALWAKEFLDLAFQHPDKMLKIPYSKFNLSKVTFTSKFSQGARFLITMLPDVDQRNHYKQIWSGCRYRYHEELMKLRYYSSNRIEIVDPDDEFKMINPRSELDRYIKYNPTVGKVMRMGYMSSWTTTLEDFVTNAEQPGEEFVIYAKLTPQERLSIQALCDGLPHIRCELLTPELFHLKVLAPKSAAQEVSDIIISPETNGEDDL